MQLGSSPASKLEGKTTVDQAIPAAMPLQVPPPPRVLEGLTAEIDKLAPTVLNDVEGLAGQIGKLAPTAFNEYARDFWQRSVLFLDILRERGNQRERMLAHGSARF